MKPRRFTPPWSIEEQDACFVVRDHNGQTLAYFAGARVGSIVTPWQSSPHGTAFT
jgi:hypothetical protein